jgi:hypothetical protein
MALVQKKVYGKNYIDYYQYYSGRYGKNIPNGPALGKTPLKQLRYQDKKAERICRYKLNENFEGGDLFLTLNYPPHQKVDIDVARKNINTFLDTVRRIYKREEKKLKYIYVAGITKKGMIHFHIVMNKLDTDVLTKAWQRIVGTEECKYPRVTIRHLDYSGEYKKLASYLIKNSREQFYRKEKVHKKRFCASKNLKMPLVTTKVIKNNRWWNMATKKAPKGYIIDKNSIYDGYGWADNGGYYECCRVQRITMYRIDSQYQKFKKSKYRKPLENIDVPEVIEDWGE